MNTQQNNQTEIGRTPKRENSTALSMGGCTDSISNNAIAYL